MSVQSSRKSADRIAQGVNAVLSIDVGRRISVNGWMRMVSPMKSDMLSRFGDTRGGGYLIKFVAELATNEG